LRRDFTFIELWVSLFASCNKKYYN
jgi:hypothetical protein